MFSHERKSSQETLSEREKTFPQDINLLLNEETKVMSTLFIKKMSDMKRYMYLEIISKKQVVFCVFGVHSHKM